MTNTSTVKVFVSYSHDTPEHKRWVTNFSSKLIENGIDVILDQWDLSLGDDVPKFMERSVTSADRVLMICTETYVRKADDGRGGVGYEAMVVTAELINDLGTTKFIPVIRQVDGENKLPKSLGSRFYVNMSHDDEAQFEALLRELHKAPATIKPTLGKNPFTKTPSGLEIPDEVSPMLEPKLNDATNPIETYNAAIRIARAGDIMQWRELIRSVKKPIPSALSIWCSNHQTQPQSNVALIQQTIEGVNTFSPLISIALAGIASGRNKFSNQLALLDEILNPKEWNRGGLNVVIQMPNAAAFVYQALHGAMCLYTNQANQAIELVRSRIKPYDYPETIEIWKMHEMIGWPTSFTGKCNEAWNVLATLPHNYPWLNDIFGDIEDYQAALAAYYVILNINEYAFLLNANHEGHLLSNTLHLDTPLFFHTLSADVKRQAFNLILQDAEQVKNIWRSLNVTDEKVALYWKDWMKVCVGWLCSGGRYFSMSSMLHDTLPSALRIV